MGSSKKNNARLTDQITRPKLVLDDRPVYGCSKEDKREKESLNQVLAKFKESNYF